MLFLVVFTIRLTEKMPANKDEPVMTNDNYMLLFSVAQNYAISLIRSIIISSSISEKELFQNQTLDCDVSAALIKLK